MNKMGQEVCFEINFVSTSLCYKDEISNKVKYFHFILQAVSFKGLYNVLSTQPVLNKVSTCKKKKKKKKKISLGSVVGGDAQDLLSSGANFWLKDSLRPMMC